MDSSLPPLLTDAEIDDLAQRLEAIKNPNVLSLEGVDGLFSALIAGPALVPPSEYLPVILGGDPGDSRAFSDVSDANATMSLLMRYWNSVIADLERESIHIPYVEEPGVDGILGRAWARGFMRGTRLAPAGWAELFTNENEGQVVTIPLVAGEVDPEWPSEPLTPEQRDELLQSMTVGAARAYREFTDLRREFAQEFTEDTEDDEFYPETYVRAEAKVGRNEPCPCGSGKKYKKCCG